MSILFIPLGLYFNMYSILSCNRNICKCIWLLWKPDFKTTLFLALQFEPYRLQSEQVKPNANSPPETRRPNSKASKATTSSASGQSRGHSSRRYPSSLLGTQYVCVYAGCTFYSNMCVTEIHNPHSSVHYEHTVVLTVWLNEAWYSERNVWECPTWRGFLRMSLFSLPWQKRPRSIRGFLCAARRPRGCRDIPTRATGPPIEERKHPRAEAKFTPRPRRHPRTHPCQKI